MSNHDYDEQRNFFRMSIETLITYKIKSSDARSHHCISSDLSAIGLYMSTDSALKEGDQIELVINPSGDHLPPLVAEGRALRTTIAEDDINKFHVSIKLPKTS
jgi:hypothetical protein